MFEFMNTGKNVWLPVIFLSCICMYLDELLILDLDIEHDTLWNILLLVYILRSSLLLDSSSPCEKWDLIEPALPGKNETA